MAKPEINILACQLGEELAKLRENAGLTQAEAGNSVKFSVKKMSRIEKGQLPDYNGLRGLLDRYGLTVDEWTPYLRLLERAQERGWWRGLDLQDHEYVAFEHHSRNLSIFQLNTIPELLQTREYARHYLTQTSGWGVKYNVECEADARVRRQQRLVDNDPLSMQAVISEHALDMRMPNRIRAAQLEFLMNQASRSNISVRVIPYAVGPHIGHRGSFGLLTFRGALAYEFAYTTHAFGNLRVNSSKHTAMVKARFKQLTKLSLSESDSIALIGSYLQDCSGG